MGPPPIVVPPAPTPVTPAPVLAPAPIPAPVQLTGDWHDWPFSPGRWQWGAEANGSVATFGAEYPPGALMLDGELYFMVRCDRPTRKIILMRNGQLNGPAQMIIRTDFGTLSWPAENGAGRRSPLWVTATRDAADVGLDQIAYSRGRFTIELPGMAPLVLRPWAEISRVIEDCR